MKGTDYISAFLDNENIITERNGASWSLYVIDPDIPCNVNIVVEKDTVRKKYKCSKNVIG